LPSCCAGAAGACAAGAGAAMGNVIWCCINYTPLSCCFKVNPQSMPYWMEDEEVGAFMCFPRSYTADLTNDPRMFMGNVINKRLEAFQTIVVAAILLASNSLTYLFDVDVNMNKWKIGFGYMSTALLSVVFVANMFAVLVLTMQFYQVFRLMTCGPTGFEASKDYYTTPTLMEMRHTAVRIFTFSLPIFLLGIGFKVMDKWAYQRGLPVFGFLVAIAFFCVLIIVRLNSVFVRLYTKLKRYEMLQFQKLNDRDFKTQSMQRNRTWVTGT
jgi:hypothetical protein